MNAAQFLNVRRGCGVDPGAGGALAVARAAQRKPDLPVARLDGPDRCVRLLIDYRESLVNERTRSSAGSVRAHRCVGEFEEDISALPQGGIEAATHAGSSDEAS